MNLTEPQAGSDLGALRTRAVPANERWGALPHHRPEDLHHLRRPRLHREHRPPGAGAHPRRAAGQPRHLAVPRAEIPARRRRQPGRAQRSALPLRLEHKLGIHASPDLRHVLWRRRRRGRLADRRGKPRPRMHVHDDEQRAPRWSACRASRSPSAPTSRRVDYARNRVQGRPVGGGASRTHGAADRPPSRCPPDAAVMRAGTEAMRALAYYAAAAIDRAARRARRRSPRSAPSAASIC